MANIGRPRRIRLENFPRKPARWLLTCRVFQRVRYWRTRRRSRQRQKVDTVTVSVHGGRRLGTTNETTMNDWDWLISLYIIYCLCPGVSLALSQYISSGVRLQTEFLFRFSIYQFWIRIFLCKIFIIKYLKSTLSDNVRRLGWLLSQESQSCLMWFTNL